MIFPLLRASLVLLATAALPIGSALAAPVNFLVSPVKFIVGTGYGTGPGQLDVAFNAITTQQSFSLNNPGDSNSFEFGTIDFNQSGRINGLQTDNLGVLAVFSFEDPLVGLRQVTATGTATVGLVNDLASDYTITWTPTVVQFDGNQSFTIEMNDLTFRLAGQSQTEFAKITLNNVPEPDTLALTALAIAGLGFVRRRR